MAKDFEEQLDRFTGLVTLSLARIGRVVLRQTLKEFIADIKLEVLKAETADLVEAAVDDGDDEGIDEIVEKYVKSKAREQAEILVDRLYDWANR